MMFKKKKRGIGALKVFDTSFKLQCDGYVRRVFTFYVYDLCKEVGDTQDQRRKIRDAPNPNSTDHVTRRSVTGTLAPMRLSFQTTKPQQAQIPHGIPFVQILISDHAEDQNTTDETTTGRL
jgi:hypothetical protein